MTDIAQLSVKVTTDGINIATKELEKLGKAADKTEKETGRLTKAAKSVGKAFTGLSGLIGGLGLGVAARAISGYTDRMAGLQGQLKLVTNSQEQLNSVYSQALNLANETGQSLEATVNLYARLSRSTEELGLSEKELLTVTKAINQSFIVSGASAQEASSAILQLSQGMAAGVLRGEELNSVMENSPRLARALADGLGVTIGQLRQMGSAGELTAEAVTGALMDMSGAIDAEFQQMPATIGRAMQEVKNNALNAFNDIDTGSAVTQIQNLADTMKDPATISGIAAMTEGIIGLTSAIIGLASSAAHGAKSIGEYFGALVAGSGGAETVEGVADQLAKLNKELAFYEANGAGSSNGVAELRAEIAKLDAILNINTKTLEGNSDNLDEWYKDVVGVNKGVSLLTNTEKKFSLIIKETNKVKKTARKLSKDELETLNAVRKAYGESGTAYKKYSDQINAASDELDELVNAGDDYADQLEFEVSLLGKNAKAQALLTAEREYSGRVTDETYQRIVAATGALADAETETKRLTTAQGPLQDALGQTIARIDTAFAQAWKGAFDSFDDFADGIKNAFRELIGELLHMAITKPIILSIGASLGIGSSAASAGGLAGGAGEWFANNSSLFSGGEFSASNAAWGVGGAVAGGLAGSAVYGNTSGAGNALGAVGGSLIPGLPPGLGTAIGSFVGGALEKFGFGEDNNGDNRGISNINLGDGSSDVYGVGKSFNAENVSALETLTLAIEGFAMVLGGSSASLSLSAGNNSGFRFQNQEYGSADEMLGAVFTEVVKSAKNLDPYLKSLILGFDGTAEEVANFAQTIISSFDSIQAMTQQNPAEKALADIEALNTTVFQGYYEQIKVVDNLIATFDGSASSFTNLNSELSTLQQNAYNLAAAIKGVSGEIGGNLLGSASDIRRSVMSEDELGSQLRKEGAWLEDILGKATNLQDILLITKELESRIVQLFGMQENPTAADAEVAAQKLEDLNAIAQQQLETALDSVVQSSEAINENTSRMLNNFSQDITDAGEQFLTAANIFLSIANSGGNNARVGLPGGEVAV